MSSPSGNRPAFSDFRPPRSGPMPPKRTSLVGKKTMPAPTLKAPRSAMKTVPRNKHTYLPSLVQFSYQQQRSRCAVNLFSIIRLALAGVNMAGIVFGAIQTRSAPMASLQTNVLKLLFLSFSLMLSVFDLIQFHYSKLPYRVEAMLDLALAFAFLSFFAVGVLVRRWTPDIVFFVASVFHLLSFFNILVRAHKISLQLQHLSSLTLRDVEKGEVASTKRSSSPIFAMSTPMSQYSFANTSGELRRGQSITETITAIRSPCVELEGSNRWTIISQKPVEHV